MVGERGAHGPRETLVNEKAPSGYAGGVLLAYWACSGNWSFHLGATVTGRRLPVIFSMLMR